MEISKKILSIPPYLSTNWDHIQSLWVQGRENNSPVLVIELKQGQTIQIPNLSSETIEEIFSFHTKSLEKEPPSPFAGPSFRLGSIGIGSLDQLGSSMQHNPDQMHAADIPKEFLEKLGAIAKALGMDKPESLPKPEPHCNCPHCQVARSLQGQILGNVDEEEVSDEDLTFRTWDVEQTGDQLYTVTNPLDKMEKYNVFLGTPIGCTCGQKNCEHIKAVLDS